MKNVQQPSIPVAFAVGNRPADNAGVQGLPKALTSTVRPLQTA
jgi:hypothetical protein